MLRVFRKYITLGVFREIRIRLLSRLGKVMTRFEKWYNPRINYDASCKVRHTYDSFYGTLYFLFKAKEVGLNREPEQFMKIQLASDPLHIFNHTTCLDSFHSSLYDDLKPLNKEGCEQFNSDSTQLHC